MPTSPMSEVIQHLRSILLLPEGADLTDGQLLECFLSRREPAALEALVRRHGPMVWGVCRRILSHHHDAEDAFQATFLVLIRKAAAVHPRARVGNWLYGVAHQTALKARATRAKRKERERPVINVPEPAAQDRGPWNDLQELLDQEISRLPEKYRTVIVLCELEGRTVKEVARHLGCPEGTVASRLSRARALLAKRLARHGLAVTGGTLAGVLSQQAASASVPTSVLYSTIKTVTSVAAGQAAAAGVLSGTVAALTEGVLKAMLLNKLMKVTAVLLVIAGLSGATGLIYHTQAAGPPKAPPTSERPQAPKTEAANKEKPSKDDRDKLQGTWRLDTSEADGIRLGEGRPEIENTLMVFKGSSVTMTGKLIHDPRIRKGPEDVKAVGKFTLDTRKAPKQIVFAWEITPWLTREYYTQRGIYALDGDTLKLGFYFPGKDTKLLAPTEFSANAGSKRSVQIYKRVPPSEKESAKRPPIDLRKIQPPGGVPLPIVGPRGNYTVDGLNKVRKRLEAVPKEDLEKWVVELERIMDQKLKDGLPSARQACRTDFVIHLSVAFDDLQWNAKAADNLFRRAQTMPAPEAKAWKQAFAALLKKEIGQTDTRYYAGGPAWAVPLVLIPVDALCEGQKYSVERGKMYRERLKQLSAEDVSLWKDKVDSFGGTQLDAAVNIILLDDYFDGEKFQRDRFKAAVAAVLKGVKDEEQQEKPTAPVKETAETDKLQGTWQMVTLEQAGVRVGEGRPELKEYRLVIEQKTFTLFSPETLVQGGQPQITKMVATFTVHAKQTPKLMVLTFKDGKKGPMTKAIYAVDGDRLKLCLGDKEAPTEFSANAGSRRSLCTFKRVSPPDKEGPKKDAQRGQGGETQKEKPVKTPPAETRAPEYRAEFRRLQTEMRKLDESLTKKYTAAKSQEEREAVMVQTMRILKEKGAPLADKALVLVRPHAADKEAVEVLTWILNQPSTSPAASAAADLLARHHLRDPQTLDAASRFQHAPMSWTEPLLRKLAAADLPRDRHIRALVSLAECAKTRAELPGMLKDLDPAMLSMVEERFGKQYLAGLRTAGPARAEAEAVGRFEELAHQYGSDKYGSGTVKDYAEGALFEMRHLAVGKQAPEIEGEDIDGNKFKLSDYRGKVVVLDFWGSW